MSTTPTSPDAGNGADPYRAAAGGRGPASPRRDRIASELAGEIRAARADITRLGRLVADNADLLAQLLPRVAQLDDTVADLAARADTPTADTPTAAVSWPALSAEQAATEWGALAEWVATVFGPFYEITRAQLPDCWALHPPAVIELIWLRRTYVAAHAVDAPASAAGEWHTRWRRDALANIATHIPTRWCRPGQHYTHEHDLRPRPDGMPREPYQHTPGHRPHPADLRVGTTGEITHPRYWEPGYRAAAAADLNWRRARNPPPDPPPASPPGTTPDVGGGR